MHARATNSPISTSVEEEKGKPISDSSRKSKDRTSEEKKRKKSSRANTQDDYDSTGKGGSDNATVRPASTDDTSSGSIAW